MDITKFIKKAVTSTSNAIDDASEALIKMDKKHKITKTIKSQTKKGISNIKNVVDNPNKIKEFVDVNYGRARNSVKSNPNINTPVDLLNNAKHELMNISSCILQIDASDNQKIANEFGNAVLGKVAGIATTGSLLGLVSAFGTAGTGASISGLSGAAATSASLAWVGGLLGGGMAAGAVLTGGVGIVAGLAAYKGLKSTPRSFESLSETEQQIVQSCWALGAIIDEELSNITIRFNSAGAEILLNNSLIPLRNKLSRASKNIQDNLDYKYEFIFRNHVLKDFNVLVISEFRKYVKRHSSAHGKNIDENISNVLFTLLTGSELDESEANSHVISALRLSDINLYNAEINSLSIYIQNCSQAELKNIARRIKGIYVELLWRDEYNACYEDSYAEVSTKTKDSGPVVLIKDSSSRRIRDRWSLFGSNFNKWASTPDLKHSIKSESSMVLDMSGTESPKSAIELLARKAGISVAASALTSLLFS